MEFPMLLCHTDDNGKDYILWVCSRCSDNECVSEFRNLENGETNVNKIPMKDVEMFVKELQKKGWQRRYLPQIEIHSDWGVKIIKSD